MGTMHDDVAVQREGVVFFGRAVSVEPEASDRCELMILVRGGLVFRVYRLHGNTASVDGSYLIYPYFSTLSVVPGALPRFFRFWWPVGHQNMKNRGKRALVKAKVFVGSRKLSTQTAELCHACVPIWV